MVKEIRKVYKSNLISENSVISSQEDIERLLNDLRNKFIADSAKLPLALLNPAYAKGISPTIQKHTQNVYFI